MLRRQPTGWDLVAAAGAGVMLVGTFLPWVRSGRVWRSSYQVATTADRLGLVGDGVQQWLKVTWFLVPALCGALLLCLVLGSPLIARGVLAILIVLVGALAVLVVRSPMPTGLGPLVAALGAATAAVGVAVPVIAQLRSGGIRGRDRTTNGHG